MHACNLTPSLICVFRCTILHSHCLVPIPCRPLAPKHAHPKPLQAKPTKDDALVSRYVRSALVVPELGQVALFSSKINISVFRLQFVLGYNWKQRLPSLDYRYVTQGSTTVVGTERKCSVQGWPVRALSNVHVCSCRRVQPVCEFSLLAT